jgi:phosphoenolpyruvate synthase/pyruvate phosphate dikinase
MMDAAALDKGEILELGEIVLRIERIFGFPQIVDWAYEDKALFMLGSRDMTHRT